jgi:mitochondrial fission protein ELM1
MSLTSAASILARAIPASAASLADGYEAPQKIVLPATESTGAEKPTVRIFVGTEAGQYRAERVFVWSIERVRDRSRRYEIYLMKHLAGFDRRGWLTGFTNYRFIIPELAGGSGRAIYNDVDQIYLSDPAELFDTPMNDHGFLSINDRDTSVMLIDCAKMRVVWTPKRAKLWRRKRVEAKARSLVGCWGQLSGHWNARDTEYVAGHSKLIHFTTIHTQPWAPFPEQYVYQHNTVGHVWHDLERSADLQRFSIFSLDEPSDALRARCAELATSPPLIQPEPPAALASLVRQTGATSVLIASVAGAGPSRELLNGSVRYETWDPAVAPQGPLAEHYDLVACFGCEHLESEDVAWFLQDLARRASRCFYVLAVALRDSGVAHKGDSGQWWIRRVESAVAAKPELRWILSTRLEDDSTFTVEGGRRDGPARNMWILANHKPGHTTQSIGLAQALGLPYELRPIGFSWFSSLIDRLLKNPLADPFTDRAAQLTPPWPDLVIATGWHTVPIALWIRKQSRGRTRIVQLGRKGGNVAEQFDAVVTCNHFRLPPHPHRIETAAPLSQVTAERLQDAARRWPDLLGDKPAPRIVALVGGPTHQHSLPPATARDLGDRLRVFAERSGGSITVVNSRRTGDAATQAIEKALGPHGHVHRWQADAVENPYLGYLAAADVLVVTGDSESMIAEAAAAGKPMYICSLPRKHRSPLEWLSERITRKAYSRPRKRRKGTVRPQQGLEYFCARLIERGLVNPPRDLNTFYEGLYDLGLARPFGEDLDMDWVARGCGGGLHEADRAAKEVQRLLGWPAVVSSESRGSHDRERTAARAL